MRILLIHADKFSYHVTEKTSAVSKLTELDESQLKGECGDCSYRDTCSGCRGRAYEETGDMMAADPGCWLAPKKGLAKGVAPEKVRY